MKNLAVLFWLFPLVLLAAEKSAKKVHEHGIATASLAFDGPHGKFIWQSPAEDIQVEKLESRIGEMIVFNPKLQCLITKDQIEIKNAGNHPDIEAEFKIVCGNSPVGSKVTFNFQKFFSSLRLVDVSVLIDTLQLNVKARSSGTVLDLQR